MKTIGELVKAREKKREADKEIIKAMQDHDFERAVYLDNQLKNFIKNDKNIDESFRRLF